MQPFLCSNWLEVLTRRYHYVTGSSVHGDVVQSVRLLVELFMVHILHRISGAHRFCPPEV